MGKDKKKKSKNKSRRNLYVIESIPSDFNAFLSTFSDEFANSEMMLQNQTFEIKKVKADTEKTIIKSTFKPHGRFEGKMEEKEDYKKKKVEFKVKYMNFLWVIKIYFIEMDSKIEVLYKYKIEGKGIMTKMIAKLLQGPTRDQFEEQIINVIEKTLKTF